MGSRIGALVARRATEVITVKRQTGHTASGDATFGSTFTMNARVERQANEATDLDGRRIDGATRLFTEATLEHGDLVWLAEGDTNDDTTALRVITITPHRDLNGTVTHCETVLS